MAVKTVLAATVVIVFLIVAGVIAYYYPRLLNISPSASPTPTPTSGPTLTPTPTSASLQTPVDQASLNWAGYAVAYNFSDPQPLVTGASGSWIVPQVQVSQNDTFSAIWVGIGGTFGQTLIQAGTEQDSISGGASYSAWYELLPFDSVTIAGMDISPGDTITTSISLVNSALNVWSINIGDLTTGQNFSQDLFYGSSRLSAEWVVERPDINGALSQIADFESVTFSNCTATVNNQIAAFGYFPSTRDFMYNMKGNRLVDVSSYFNNGSSFTATYLKS